jgi:ABC-type Mn2+/Zn2+ transport system ATPase subunit
LQRQLSQVAYVPQRSNIDWDYPVTVEQVVMMARTIPTGWGRSPDRQSWQLVKEALARVGMEKYSDRQIGELSGGQQQRVFLARSLAAQASLLFFDEPFSGIDRQTEAIMFEILVELKAAGKTILVISHDWGESLKNYDYLLMLNKGVVAAGERQDVLHQRSIQNCYGSNLQNYFLAPREGFSRSA